MKKIVIISYLLIYFLLIGCQYSPIEYTGDYPDLFTVALYSIPDASGYFKTEISENPSISLLETDDYGRKLFRYFEGHSISTFNLVIMQFSTNSEACFYSLNNFISSPTEEFSETEISILKELNDWNLNLDKEKATCIPITLSKEEMPLTYEEIKPFYEKVFPGEEHYDDDKSIEYYISDQYGRILVTALSRAQDEWALMLFNSDGTFDSENGYIIFSDFYTYQEDMREFLNSVDWDEPL